MLKRIVVRFLLRDVVLPVMYAIRSSYWFILDHISSQPEMYQKSHVITERELTTNIQLLLTVCHLKETTQIGSPCIVINEDRNFRRSCIAKKLSV
jgi:hypothetical protein